MTSFSRLFLFTITLGTPLIAQGTPPPPDLQSFPVKESLWLSMSKSHVSPAQNMPLSSSFEGYLQINTPNHTFIPKDQVWGIQNPKRLNFSQKSLDLTKTKASQKIKKINLDYLDAVSAQEDKLAALITEGQKLQATLTSSTLTQNSNIKKLLQNALKKMDEQKSREQQRLENLNSKTNLETEISQIKLDLKKKQDDHEQLQKSSELTAPFEGTLNLQIPSLSEDTEYPISVWINTHEPIGTLSNNSRFEVLIKGSSTSLFQVNKNSLFLKMNIHNKKQTIYAKYFRTQQAENSTTYAPPTLIFQVDKADTIKAQELSGSQPLAHIYTKLPKNCHIVSKASLLPYLSQLEDRSNWKETTEQLWPKSQLIAIGKTALAVQAPSN
jgi:hypothetical protein